MCNHRFQTYDEFIAARRQEAQQILDDSSLWHNRPHLLSLARRVLESHASDNNGE